MKQITYIASLFTITIFLQSCRPKPIDIYVKTAPVKMVVASSVIQDGFIIVFLSRTFSGLEGKLNKDSLGLEFFEKIAVTNAFVTINHNGIIDTLFELEGGFYGTQNLQFKEYDNYDLYARDNKTGEEITATTNLLPYYQFDVIKPYKVFNGIDTACRVYFELSDDLTRENYYVVNYIRKEEKKTGKRIDVNRVFSGNGASVETDFDLLNDDSFTDGKYKVDKILKSVKPSDSLAISLASISRGYYEFLTAFKRSGSLINTLTSEPINYPTNVRNGYGYFNAYTPEILFIDMRLY
jgi:hypothetical protein